MLRRKRAQVWGTYTKVLEEANIKAGSRTTKRLHFMNISQQTLEDVKEAAKFIEPELDKIVEQFYQNIIRDKDLQFKIKEYTTENKFKNAIKNYVSQLIKANVDESFVQSRVKIGQMHSKIDLSANYFIMGHSLLIQFVSAILMQKLNKSPDKMIRLSLSFQKLANYDQQLIVDVYYETTFKYFLREAANMLNEITELDTTQHLIETMNKQMDETHSVTAATEQMSTSIQDVSNHAVRVAEGTEAAVQSAENSRKVIDEALNDIEEVGQVYDVVMEDVNQLGNEIENTHEIINVIKEIADQTNLLALNASIEAARAGEAGQGFGVVATEVRKLSEHTKDQIEQITTNMGTLQGVSKQVTDRIQQTGKSVEKSVAGSQIAGKELASIIETMQSINQETTQIAAMSEEQSSTVVEISDRNMNMYELSEEVQKLTEETAGIIYDISKNMETYRLKFIEAHPIYDHKELINMAVTDHLLWKWKIYNMLLGLDEVSLDTVTTHTECRLGKWYYDELPNKIKQLDAYKQLEQPHKEVHDCARHAVVQYQQDDIFEAKEALKKLEVASSRVVMLLKELRESV